jgi:hypothetical protein
MNNIQQKLMECPACGKDVEVTLGVEMEGSDHTIVDGRIEASVKVTGARIQHDCMKKTTREPTNIFNAGNCHEAAAQR